MNIIQATGAIKDAKDHDQLFAVMQTAKAPAHWSRYTDEQREELCDLAEKKSHELAEAMRTSATQQEERIDEAVRGMRNPPTRFL